MNMDLSPKFPRTLAEAEGGGYYNWASVDSPVLVEAKVAAGKLVLKPRSLALPHFSDCSKVGYVLEGNCGVGLTLPGNTNNEIAFIGLKKGDIIPVPSGSVSWWYNHGISDVVIVFLGDATKAHVPGEITYFLLAGPLGHLAALSPEFVARTYSLNVEKAQKLANSQKGVLIIKLDQEEAEDIPKPYEDDDVVKIWTQNIDGASPDVEVKNGGKSTTLTGTKFPFLEEVGLSVSRLVLETSATRAPLYASDAQVFYVAKGSGEVQIVGPEGKLVLNTNVESGQIFVVPKFFMVTISADGEGMELVSIVTSPRPVIGELAGNGNCHNNCPSIELVPGFKADEDMTTKSSLICGRALVVFFLFVLMMKDDATLLFGKQSRRQQKQPGCSSELSGVESNEVQLIQIKITSAGLWSQNESEPVVVNNPDLKTVTENVEVANVDNDGLMFLAAKFWLNWFGSGARKGKLALKFWKTDGELIEQQAVSSITVESSKPTIDDVVVKIDKETYSGLSLSAKQTFKAAVTHLGKKCYRRLSFIWRHAIQIFGSFQKLWNITGLNLDVPKWLRILHFNWLNSYAVHWLEKRSKAFEPTYLYTMEKGYFLLPDVAKSQHNIRTINISISARHPCFGNRWQHLLINRFVGYDTIMMNSLLHQPGQGYLYNFQTKEFYNLSYAQELPDGSARLGDYLVTKCGVLMMSLFVFFTTTMSVSFTLRETQTRMLKFTVQLQHNARHRLPTFQLIFVHVIESLVFVPIMIGILFFLFEFYDDQLLAFTVLILVWLCELFILISVRTPISMKFFPRFFSLYFLVFHIYFFSYAYGFSYLALSTAAAFMQHLILYFWNRFEVPAVQRFMQNRRSQLQQHPDFHITSSTILASTLHIRRLNTRNPGLENTDPTSGPGSRTGSDQAVPANGAGEAAGPQGHSGNDNMSQSGNPVQRPGQPELQQAEAGSNSGTVSSFSSLLLWILGGASSEGLNSFLSMFRDEREQGQVYTDSPSHENRATQNDQ